MDQRRKATQSLWEEVGKVPKSMVLGRVCKADVSTAGNSYHNSTGIAAFHIAEVAELLFSHVFAALLHAKLSLVLNPFGWSRTMQKSVTPGRDECQHHLVVSIWSLELHMFSASNIYDL